MRVAQLCGYVAPGTIMIQAENSCLASDGWGQLPFVSLIFSVVVDKQILQSRHPIGPDLRGSDGDRMQHNCAVNIFSIEHRAAWMPACSRSSLGMRIPSLFPQRCTVTLTMASMLSSTCLDKSAEAAVGLGTLFRQNGVRRRTAPDMRRRRPRSRRSHTECHRRS